MGGETGEKIDAGIAALGIFPRGSHFIVLPGADSQEDGIETVCSQALDRKIPAQFDIHFCFDTQIQDTVGFPLEHFLGKPVFGNAVSDHTTQFGHHVKNRDLMTQAPQKIGTAESRRAAADNGNLFVGVRCAGNRQSFAGVHLIIGHKAFELVDGDRFVIFDGPAAVVFTGVGADPAAGQEQGVSFPNGMNRPFVIPFPDLGDVFRYIDFRRAGLLTWREGVLGLVEFEEPLAHGPDGEDLFRAGLFTGAATHALCLIDFRVTVLSHMDGVKTACVDAVSKTETADAAHPPAAVESSQGAATRDAHVMVVVFGPVPAQAVILGEFRFGRSRVYAHDSGHLKNCFLIRNDADTRGGFTGYHRHGGG